MKMKIFYSEPVHHFLLKMEEKTIKLNSIKYFEFVVSF